MDIRTPHVLPAPSRLPRLRLHRCYPTGFAAPLPARLRSGLMRYRSATVADSHGLPRCLRYGKRTANVRTAPTAQPSGNLISCAKFAKHPASTNAPARLPRAAPLRHSKKHGGFGTKRLEAHGRFCSTVVSKKPLPLLLLFAPSSTIFLPLALALHASATGSSPAPCRRSLMEQICQCDAAAARLRNEISRIQQRLGTAAERPGDLEHAHSAAHRLSNLMTAVLLTRDLH